MMKNTPEDQAVTDRVTTAAQAELRAFVERYERVQADIDALKEDQKEIVAELKGRGYQVKPFKEVIKLRKQDANDRAEFEAVLDMYKEAALDDKA